MKRLVIAMMTIDLLFFGTAETFAQHIKPQRSAARQARRVEFGCSPRKLRRGGTLVLTMSAPHGRDLAIISPDDRFSWLRSWEPQDGEATARWYAFEKVRRLELSAAEVTGKASHHNNELIFTKTGWYRVRLSDNLETDDGTPFYECKVYYVHKPGP